MSSPASLQGTKGSPTLPLFGPSLQDVVDGADVPTSSQSSPTTFAPTPPWLKRPLPTGGSSNSVASLQGRTFTTYPPIVGDAGELPRQRSDSRNSASSTSPIPQEFSLWTRFADVSNRVRIVAIACVAFSFICQVPAVQDLFNCLLSQNITRV